MDSAPANTAPVAVNDAYATPLNTPLVVAAATGVLDNDTDADNDTLTAAKVTDPANGTVTLNPNGGFTYTPTAGYSGPDSFTYRANDGTVNSNIATVTITVGAALSGPIALWTMNEASGTTGRYRLRPGQQRDHCREPDLRGRPDRQCPATQRNLAVRHRADEATLDITSAITMAAWVKPETAGVTNIPQLLVQKAITGRWHQWLRDRPDRPDLVGAPEGLHPLQPGHQRRHVPRHLHDDLPDQRHDLDPRRRDVGRHHDQALLQRRPAGIDRLRRTDRHEQPRRRDRRTSDAGHDPPVQGRDG